MKISHDPPSLKALETLEALRTAVAEALDKKKRLGQYAVFWSGNKPVFVGDDVPEEYITYKDNGFSAADSS